MVYTIDLAEGSTQVEETIDKPGWTVREPVIFGGQLFFFTTCEETDEPNVLVYKLRNNLDY